jgi:hypothetical protein
MIQKLQKQNLLVICYSNPWHLALSIEFLNYEASLGKVYDIIDASFVGDNFIVVKLKKLLGRYQFYHDSLRYIHLSKFRIINLNKVTMKDFRFKRNSYLDHNPLDMSPAYNSIVENYGSMDLKKMNRSLRGLRIKNREIKKCDKLYKKLSKLGNLHYETVVTVNGRFSKNSTVLLWAKKNNLITRCLEFGAQSKNSFEIFDISPHSMTELQDKIERYWLDSSDPLKSQKAASYLHNLVTRKSSSSVDFRGKIAEGKIPTFRSKKICVFYASTEFEYAGVGDRIETGLFATQVDAFQGLVEILNPGEWDIFLRRHPKPKGSRNRDGEKFLWDKYYAVQNVKIIEPDSDIDSLALGTNSHLIASFWSTINMEFYARGFSNVVNLGPTSWSRLVPSRYLPNKNAISKYISCEPPLISIDDVLPWAYFHSEFGNEFSLINVDPERGNWSFKN